MAESTVQIPTVAPVRRSLRVTGKRRPGTAERILDVAGDLFAAEGVRAVSTNRIASTARISPGNLYYWYADRQAIVRALFDRYSRAHAAVWDGVDPDNVTPERLDRLVAAGARITADHPYFARDLITLVRDDEELAEAYRAVRVQRRELFGRVARGWRARGVLVPVDDERLEHVVEALLVLAESWWAFAQLDDERPEPVEGERLIRALIEPYLVAGAAPASPQPSAVPAPPDVSR